MKLALVTLYVNDMEKSLNFYNTLLEIPISGKRQMAAGKDLVFLGDAGHVNLELIPCDTQTSYQGFSIGFNVENLESAKQRLSAAGYEIKREFSPMPSVTLCFFDGPNGEEIELIENK
jgi:lactoylglutathione lyase